MPGTNASPLWVPLVPSHQRGRGRGAAAPCSCGTAIRTPRPPWASPHSPVPTELSPFLPDVDECASRSHSCSQLCVNTAGSFRCACRDGFSLAADHKACQPAGLGPGPGTFSQAGNLLLRQHSPSCSGPLMQAGITSRHHKVAGAGLARDRRGDSSQHPSALFPVTQETPKKTPSCTSLAPARVTERAVACGGRGCGRALRHHRRRSSRRAQLEPRGASGAAGDGPLLLLVRAVTLQTRTVSNNALWPALAS